MTAPDTADAEDIVSSRLFAAPRNAVFAAFTDAERLARWWGPNGFTSTFQEFDPRPGGSWRFVMHGPDGADYAMLNVFEEVVPGERIVLRHVQQGHDFRLAMTLDDEAGGTRLTWRMRFESPDEAERVRGPVLAANEQNFDRLQAVLAG